MPRSKVLAVSGDNIFVMFAEKLKGLGIIDLSETGGGKAVVQLLSISQFYYEDIYLKLDKTSHPAYLSRTIYEKHSKNSGESIRAQGYRYGLRMITLLVSVELSSDAFSVRNLFDETKEQKVVKYGFAGNLL